jgi:sugar phosphate isomerase/epimerase
VARLAAAYPELRDIELLLFDVRSLADLPDANERARLAELALQHDLSYCVHLPLDLDLGARDDVVRGEQVARLEGLLQAMAPVFPQSYVLHLDPRAGSVRFDEASEKDWLSRASQSLRRFDKAQRKQFCVEWLDASFERIWPAVEALGLSIALDVGHLLRDGIAPQQVLERFASRTRIIHWHGVAERDHRSLRHYPRKLAELVLDTLEKAQYAGVLTLEVFSETDLAESMDRLRALLPDLGAQRG